MPEYRILDMKWKSWYTFSDRKAVVREFMFDEKDRKIQELEEKLRKLQKENDDLKDTVQWMHDMIWKMVRERESAIERD